MQIHEITEAPRDMGVSDLDTKDAVQNRLDYVYNNSARGRVRQGKTQELNDGTFVLMFLSSYKLRILSR